MNDTTAITDQSPDPFAPHKNIIQSRRILVVDDETGVRSSLSLYLKRTGFFVDEAENGLEAKSYLVDDVYFLVFTDITMPQLTGLELLAHINSLEREIDVVMITGHMNIDYAIGAIKKGAFDYLKKPFMLDDVKATILRVLEKQQFKRQSIELEKLRERQKTESKNMTEFMIMLANIIDAKSPFTQEHSERVSEYSVMIAREIGLPHEEVHLIGLGAKLHDIGKLATPDYILNKQGPLTDEEYETIKDHSARGSEMINPISSLQNIRDIVRYHHENLDGTGYPEGLKGDEIPFHARIVKIADYFDAVTSKRPYREPMSEEKASQILLEEARNGKLEPALVDALLKQISLIPTG
jgi:putative two-component system response regulator